MGVSRRRVVRDDVVEKGDLIPVDARLPPTQRSQQHQHGQGEAQRALPRDFRQFGQAPGRGPDDDGQRPDSCQILVPVRDKGELHVAVAHEPEHRQQRDREEQDARQRSPANSMPQKPERRGHGDGSRNVSPGQWVRDGDLPVWVDDRQPGGPEQRAEVEPQGVGCEQHPFNR